MPETFETPWVLFCSIIGGYLIVSMFVLGGWSTFFEPYSKPKDAE